MIRPLEKHLRNEPDGSDGSKEEISVRSLHEFCELPKRGEDDGDGSLSMLIAKHEFLNKLQECSERWFW